MLNSLETAFDELTQNANEVAEVLRGIGSEFSEMSETQSHKPKRERFAEGEERPYICVHADKGKHECTATSKLHGALQKSPAHWGLKSTTAGIDAHQQKIFLQQVQTMLIQRQTLLQQCTVK